MGSRRSKRDRLLNFLDESSEAFKGIFRPRSPRPSSSSGLQPSTQPSTATPGDSVSTGTNVPSSISGTQDTALAVLKSSLRGLNNGVSLVPAFKSVIGILTECVDNIPDVISNRKDFDNLALNIAVSARGLGQQLKQANTARMAKAIENVLEELDKEASSIIQKQGRTTAREFIDVEQDIDDLIQGYRRVEALFRQLHRVEDNE
ncbi:hypothetical protein FRC09_009927 [Ceratobasidium sp. 395]|nr:hypothetical protein FRC09_009927 [Ceratobasidium sp. 395]